MKGDPKKNEEAGGNLKARINSNLAKQKRAGN